MKEEALKLADELEALHQYVPSEAPAMIRRLVAENDFLKDWRDTWSPYINQYVAKTKPLSDDEILDMSDDYIANQFELAFEGDKLVEYVRAVMKKAGQR